jgi:hypothetical protein
LTLETLYAGDYGDKDPIPPEKYSAFVRRDRHPNRIELKNVPGYENIQIHIANDPEDLEGCFGVGTKRSRDSVLHSATALKKILDIIRMDKTGKITVNVIGPSVKE